MGGYFFYYLTIFVIYKNLITKYRDRQRCRNMKVFRFFIFFNIVSFACKRGSCFYFESLEIYFETWKIYF